MQDRLDEQAVQRAVGGIAKDAEPQRHRPMAVAGLRPVGPEQPVPQRQIEAVVAVGLVAVDRMVHPVHVRGDDQPADERIDPRRQVDIRMVEHGERVQADLEDDDRRRRRAKGND